MTRRQALVIGIALGLVCIGQIMLIVGRGWAQ